LGLKLFDTLLMARNMQQEASQPGYSEFAQKLGYDLENFRTRLGENPNA
jgi:hypothetical protein